MRVNNISLSFKGYDAAPLKKIYLNDFAYDSFNSELWSIFKGENIDFKTTHVENAWIQDASIITEKDGKPCPIGELSTKKSLPSYIEGGNTFIGKYDNGQKWMLIGEKETDKIDDDKKKEISELLNIPAENIFGIKKPNFHLDMAIRPIGFPNILVNDPELAEKTLEELDDGSDEYIQLKNIFNESKKEDCDRYASCDETCSELQSLGFNPIRVAGNFYDGINFMNAIVNKHSDGKISYITNSSKCYNHIFNKIQDKFEQEIKEKVQYLDKIYFVKGNENSFINQGLKYISSNDPRNRLKSNYLINSLRYLEGGLHCLTLEEPNFEKWA